jgi:hypothetical protein
MIDTTQTDRHFCRLAEMFDCPAVQSIRLAVAITLSCRNYPIFFKKARNAMKNPWTKKNPFLSMWLSGANALTGAARGRATAEGKRQATTMMNQGLRQMTNFWGNALSAPPKRKKRKQK